MPIWQILARSALAVSTSMELSVSISGFPFRCRIPVSDPARQGLVRCLQRRLCHGTIMSWEAQFPSFRSRYLNDMHPARESTGNQAGVRNVTRAGVRHVGAEGIVPGVPRTVAVAAVRCVAVTCARRPRTQVTGEWTPSCWSSGDARRVWTLVVSSCPGPCRARSRSASGSPVGRPGSRFSPASVLSGLGRCLWRFLAASGSGVGVALTLAVASAHAEQRLGVAVCVAAGG